MSAKPLNFIKYFLAVTTLLFAFSISSVRAAPVFFDYIGADNNASAFGSFSLDEGVLDITSSNQKVLVDNLSSFTFSFTNLYPNPDITDTCDFGDLVLGSFIHKRTIGFTNPKPLTNCQKVTLTKAFRPERELFTPLVTSFG